MCNKVVIWLPLSPQLSTWFMDAPSKEVYNCLWVYKCIAKGYIFWEHKNHCIVIFSSKTFFYQSRDIFLRKCAFHENCTTTLIANWHSIFSKVSRYPSTNINYILKSIQLSLIFLKVCHYRLDFRAGKNYDHLII